MKNMELGKFGEEIAAKYLSMSGYEILEKNFRCRVGEVDLIVRKDDVLVFIEVKTRTSDSFGLPSQAVDSKKQSHIKKVAGVYLLSNNFRQYDVRYDVFELYCNQIESAF